MTLIPYKRIRLESNWGPAEIKERLSKLVVPPDRRIDANKLSELKVFEAAFAGQEFTVVWGRYGLSWGILSLLPVMKGRIREKGFRQGCSIVVVVRPLFWGLVIFLPFLVLGIAAIVLSISSGNLGPIVVTSSLFLISYISVVSRFNDSMKHYRKLIEEIC